MYCSAMVSCTIQSITDFSSKLIPFFLYSVIFPSRSPPYKVAQNRNHGDTYDHQNTSLASCTLLSRSPPPHTRSYTTKNCDVITCDFESHPALLVPEIFLSSFPHPHSTPPIGSHTTEMMLVVTQDYMHYAGFCLSRKSIEYVTRELIHRVCHKNCPILAEPTALTKNIK